MSEELLLALLMLKELGRKYREDWSGFDGRTLRREIDAIVDPILEKKEAVTRNTAVLQMALEIADLRKELQFWACEGQRHDPEADKWRELAQKPKPTKADVKRMSEIARKMRIAAEDEPELRARIAEQDIELERLRKLLSEHDGQPESASGASQ